MADPTIPIGHRDGVTLLEYLRKVGVDLEGDFLSQGTQLLAQLAIEFEAEQQIGAGRYPGRTPGRCDRYDLHRPSPVGQLLPARDEAPEQDQDRHQAAQDVR